MSITIRYFASLREQIGRGEDRLDAAGIATVDAAWQHLHGTPLPARVLAAVNQEYVGAEHVLTDGDEVAFFPPVTGG
ncbi:molybdopterin converting factor subunit 1 [Acidihalobacter ferrooxydans]|uniref:Molybdopterin synthase sulfur carrier subunit n=1 Tax=Acidihalobacter ferrooxydans TaxID=1765967 RepID=A0A1P8UJU4_9GAMM|nr:molybdopterin converting factor subunit 1 [Acidihalobacter ferrooxydans]APZ44032.1 molybdopterin converting factor subunit 1 [Acidihalobacter ferrooxydans]